MTRLYPSLIFLLAAYAAGCGSSSTTILNPANPSAQRCAVTLNVSASSIASAGGSGTISVATARECEWTLTAGSNWVAFNGPATGQGPAERGFSVQPNRSTSPRSVEVSVNDQRTTISQEAATCPWKVSPSELVMGPAGGDRTVNLSTEDFCSWVVTSRDPWVTVASAAKGTGSAEFVLRVARNDGPERSAKVEVPGGTVSVLQREGTPPPPPQGVPPAPPAEPTPPPVVPSPPVVVPPPVVPAPEIPPTPEVPPPPAPCTFQVAPTSFDNVPVGGGGLRVDVTTQSLCAWSAASNATWVAISSGAAGTGSGAVQLNVSENTGAARTGTLVIAGQSVTVSQQSRPPCAYTIDPGSYNPSSTGGTVSVTVTTTAECEWTVSGNPGWVSANPTGRTGTGTTVLTVQSNSGGARSATFAIAGQNFTVNQESRPPCAYTINPSSYTPSSTGGTTSVTVTTTAECEWTVTNVPAWITANPTGRTGAGTTAVTVQSNDGAARSATLKIAGRDFVVQQASAPCTYLYGPTSRTIPAWPTTTRELGITTQNHCPVAASTNVSWIEIMYAPTFGSGEVGIRILENKGKERTGTVTISGQGFSRDFTIIQEGRD